MVFTLTKELQLKIKYLFILLAVGVQSFSALMLPTRFDHRIDGRNGGYQEYQIHNTTNDTVRYRIHARPQKDGFEEDGLKGDMTKWVSAYPRILTIQPRSIGTVKVSVKAPPSAEAGEYSTYIGTTPMAIPQMNENTGAIAPSISVGIGYEMRIYGTVGELKPAITGKIETISNERGNFFKGYIENTGTAGINVVGMYSYTENGANKSMIIPIGRISPGQKIDIDSSKIHLPSGHRAINFTVTGDGSATQYFRHSR